MKKVCVAFSVVLFFLFLASLAGPCEASVHAVIAQRSSDVLTTIRAEDLTVFEKQGLFPNTLEGRAFGVAITPDGYAYVTNPGEGAVYILDPLGSQSVLEIDVGGNPLGIAASPDGHHVYVTNSGNDTLSVIDTIEKKEVFGPSGPIQVGGYPVGVAVSPDSLVYVANQKSDSVSIIRTSEDVFNYEVIEEIDVGTAPLGVAVSPDGRHVYVTNFGEDTLSVIDTIEQKEVFGPFSGRIKVGGRPIGVAVSPDGQFIYVANHRDDTVSVIQTAENVVDYEVITEIEVGAAPLGIAVTPDGAEIFVTNEGRGTDHGSVSIINTSDYHVATILESENSPASFGQFIGSISAPQVPSELQATAVSETEITLAWTDNSTDELGFILGRRTESDAAYVQIAVVDANVVIYSDIGLNEATAYAYKILAYNTLGNSAESNRAITVTLPRAPSDLTVEALPDNQVYLKWTDNSNGESGYRIERKTAPNGTYERIGEVDANVETFIDSGLDEATVYYYRIKAYIEAYNSAADSSPCTEAGITTCPAAPTDLVLRALSQSQVSISWQDSAKGRSGYKIERKKISDQRYEQIAVVDPAIDLDGKTTKKTFTDSGLSETTTYYYQISAFSDSCSAGPSVESIITTDSAAPSNLTASALSTSRVKLSWKDNSAFTKGFLVQRKLATKGSDYESVSTINDPDVTSYTDSGLKELGEYTYRVWSFILEPSAFDLQDKSNHSNEESVTTRLAAPSNLSATSSKGAAILTWKDNSSVEPGFEIERKTLSKKNGGAASADNSSDESENGIGSASDDNSSDESGAFALIAKVGSNVLTYTDDNVDPGTDYVYRVRALAEKETSDYSNEAELDSSSSSSCFIETAAGAYHWGIKW